MQVRPGTGRSAARYDSASPAPSAHANTTRLIAPPRTLMALQSTKLLGVLGVLAIFWSRGSDGALFALGMVLLLGAVLGFRGLRARLITRVEQHWILTGVRATSARRRAALDVDELLQIAARPRR